MVRTKADSCAASRKVVAAQAPRKSLGASSSSSSTSSSGTSPSGKKYSGGNPVCPRPTPDWQKGIGPFLTRKPANKENEEPHTEEEAGCSSSTKDSQSNEANLDDGCTAGSSRSDNEHARPSRIMDDSDDD